MRDKPEWERRLDALYAALRNGAAIDREAAFDAAMAELTCHPGQARARELAEASVSEADEARLASVARAFLDACGYVPGFDQEPELLSRLEASLEVVRADLRATGVAGQVRLVVGPDWFPSNVVVETWKGDHGWTSGIFPSDAADDLSALVAVAEQVREAVMESLDYQFSGRVWPACPAHGGVTTPMAHLGVGVWWCESGGHVAAKIGHWPEGHAGHGVPGAQQLPGSRRAVSRHMRPRFFPSFLWGAGLAGRRGERALGRVVCARAGGGGWGPAGWPPPETASRLGRSALLSGRSDILGGPRLASAGHRESYRWHWCLSDVVGGFDRQVAGVCFGVSPYRRLAAATSRRGLLKGLSCPTPSH